MTKKVLMFSVLLLSLTLTVALTNAQSQNLLQNPNADQETRHWRLMGEATVASTTANNGSAVPMGNEALYWEKGAKEPLLSLCAN